jgi:hypothetical protein
VYEVPQHLRLSELERDRILSRISDDVRAANSDHSKRMSRFRRYMRAYRLMDRPIEDASKRDAPNYRVPLILSSVQQALSACMQALFGSGLKITAEPTEPTDVKATTKVSLYMKHRVINYMKIYPALAAFKFRVLLFGRAFAYRPWKQTKHRVYDRRKQAWVEQIGYDGPAFVPLLPDDILIPAEEGTIQEVSFVVRKYRATPQELLDGEKDGLYYGIKENWESIVRHARSRRTRNVMGDADDLKREIEEAEGVSYEGMTMGGGETLLVHEWYGRWRLPRKGNPSTENVEGRQYDQTDLVVRLIPDMPKMMIGCQKLEGIYPTMRDKRPFYDSTLLKDGSAWPMGMAEMLERIEEYLSNNRNLATRAQQFSVGPVIFYTAASGFNPDGFNYEPFTTYEVGDAKGIVPFRADADLSGAITMEQAFMADAERASGRTDYGTGRDIDRPTAPRTATGLVTLVQEGKVRASLDMLSMAADDERLLSELWQLEQCWGDEQTFFRVTGEEGSEFFDVTNGLAQFSSEDRDGHYDFHLTFADSQWAKEGKQQRFFQLYQVLAQSPVVQANPNLMGQLAKRLAEELDFPDLAKLIPVPPAMAMPRTPNEEWTLMQQGEDVEPHEMDDDNNHAKKHRQQLDDAMSVEPEKQDPDAIMRLRVHLGLTESQQKQKRLMQALIQMAAQSMAKQQQQHPMLQRLAMRGSNGQTQDETIPGGAGGLGAPEAPAEIGDIGEAAGLPGILG